MEKLRRVVAMISVIFIVALIVTAFILGILGSRYFVAVTVLAIVVPVVLWVFMWFTHLISDDSGRETEKEQDTKTEEETDLKK